MKGFIEVNVYSKNNQLNKRKVLFPIGMFAVDNNYIIYNGVEYNCVQSYEEIKEMIKNAVGD